MAERKINFWNWDKAVLTRAVAELMHGWSGGQLDLSQSVIIVPTGEAVRRLREALAVAAAEKDGAVIAPFVWHPEQALIQAKQANDIASALTERLAWSRVLMEANLADFAALFPNPPGETSIAWAASVAETLRSLRHTLGAGGLAIKDVARMFASQDDASRWSDLALLEEAYLKIIRGWKMKDAQEAKRHAAEQAELPAGVERVIVFAVPDAPVLFRRWLEKVSASCEVQIFVHAPESGRAEFDPFGAPLVTAWGDEAGLVLPLNEERMHRAPGPEDQARLAASLLNEMASRGLSVASGSADPALNSVLEGTFSAGGARVFNPASRAARQHVLVQVLRDGWRAKHQPAWRAWLPFLRQHDVLDAVGKETGIMPGIILDQLDKFHAAHLPATLEDALALSKTDDAFQQLHVVLNTVAARSELWAHPSSAEAVRTFLEWIYGAREFNSSAENHRHYGELFSEALRLADEVDAAGGGAEWFGLALDALEESPLGDVHGAADLVLYGWLELLWEPARGLVITGMNDAHVPGIVVKDPFLPDKARESLGLSCQKQRRARDAYLLRAMSEQRRADDGLHVIFGHVNADGDAMRPSRLLMDCEDKNLPARVKRLFPNENSAVPSSSRPRRELAFALRPELTPWKGVSVSASDLKSYLACPFRFYLAKVLRLKEVETGQRELSPIDIGNMMHDVLKAFADCSEVKDSHHAKDIGDWLESNLEKRTMGRYGPQPLFSVALQIESMRQRLRKFAEVQAGIRGEGWKIIAAEERITPEWDIKMGGLTFSGKIDRVDKNEKTGALRVIDYKTSAASKGPAGGHVKKASHSDLENEHVQWQCFDDSRDKPQRWSDLQLPLYALAAAAKWPDASKVDAAYLCLPAAVDGIGLKEWVRDAKTGVLWNDELLKAAKYCADEAVRRMSAGVFWPPTEKLAYDDFADLLLDDAAVSVRPPEEWGTFA